MATAKRNLLDYRPAPVFATHIPTYSPRREEAESFIRKVFSRHYGAEIPAFAPNLMLIEHEGHIAAAAGWRSAATDTLFLERYLDMPIELAMAQLADQPVARDRIVEVGNLAAERNGSSVTVILALANHLDRLGYEWVVFTATSELVGIFSRLGLPLLALAPADPARFGEEAKCWGSYYDTQPIVVAGRIRMALERAAGGA